MIQGRKRVMPLLFANLPSRAEVPTPTDMAIEKSGGGMMIKVKSGKKMEQIPTVLGEWTARKLYCVPGVSIKSLSTQIGINSNYLSFYFNHVLGANFHQWLYTLRIEEAKQIILHNPGVKYNFSRWFKSITGMTAVIWLVVP